eukprot:c43703_g1_i1 orf=402-602(+)
MIDGLGRIALNQGVCKCILTPNGVHVIEFHSVLAQNSEILETWQRKSIQSLCAFFVISLYIRRCSL